MRLFSRRSADAQPRLLGRTEPHYDRKAMDFFIRVLTTAGNPYRRPSGEDLEFLAQAEELARMYCNDVLLADLRGFLGMAHAFRDGQLPQERMQEAESRFAERCRLALGTND